MSLYFGPAYSGTAAKSKEESINQTLNAVLTALNPFDKQVGGDHYKDYVIPPYEFFFRNKIPHHKAAIIRRILRYDHPTGKGIVDLDKISHEIELIKELEYGKEYVG